MATTETLDDGRVVGTPVPRKEDQKLLTGHGQWVDNINLPGMVWLAVVRSPYAHARDRQGRPRRRARTSRRRRRLRGAELADEWAGSLPCAWPDRRHHDAGAQPARVRQGALRRATVSRSSWRETRAIAKDAAELVEVEYEPLAGRRRRRGKALDDGAPLVHDEFGTNDCYIWKLDAGEVDQAVRGGRRHGQGALPPEPADPERDRAARRPRAAAAGDRRVHAVVVDADPAHRAADARGVVGIPEAKLRVIAPDVGGGFGSKLDVYAEEALASRSRGGSDRPVKWIEERSEGYRRRRSTAAT